jgi:hypothetical protein
MTKVERRQARLRKIQAKIPSDSKSARVNDFEDTLPRPEAHHVIGKTENLPQDIGPFVRENQEDPATQVGITFHQCVDYH